MQVENKYYTPIPAEFHIGFEYEEKNNDGSWFKSEIYGKSDFENLCETPIENFRVKYLDKEDIEISGWESGMHINVWSENDDIIEGYSISQNSTDTYILLYNEENNMLGIYSQRIYNEITGNWTEHILFSGIINNISELRRLMQQLSIALT